DQVYENVLEARTDRRELGENPTARPRRVDESVQVREVARRQNQVAVDALDAGPARAERLEQRLVDGRDRHAVARLLRGEVGDAPLPRDLSAAQHRDAVAGELDLREQVLVQQ